MTRAGRSAGAVLCMGLGAALAAGAQPRVEYGARVRVVAPAAGPGWHAGLVGRVGACLAVMVPRDPDHSASFHALRFAEIDSLRISTRYPGTPDARGRARLYRAGADTVGEGWADVPVAPLRARYARCTPF